MLQKKMKFVELSKGSVEGTDYNNVALSDGIRTATLKNQTGQDDYLATLKEGQEVTVTLDAVIVKGPNRTSRFDVSLHKVETVAK